MVSATHELKMKQSTKPVKRILNKTPSTGKPKKLEWEIEFDEEFKSLANEYCDPTNDVKDFISKTLQQQREKEMCRLVKILNKMKWKNIRKTMLLSYRNGSLGFHTGSGFDHHELTIGTLEEYGNYHYNEAISDVLQLLKEKK